MSVDYATENGMSIMNQCYECMIIARDIADGLPVGKCQECTESDEAKSDNNAWNLHEDDRLGEGKALSLNVEEPSGSDWVSSQTYVRPAKTKAIMFEKWSDDCKLEMLTVEFIEQDEDEIRHEFLPPIAQLQDGGVYEELWELEDERQRAREVECNWCHILTPKVFNDCQSCDKPLELNVR
jgi:hypothetical protein